LPSPTSTPQTYTIQQGDSFLAIAIRYKTSVQALQAANPKVDPNMMALGTVLIIPASTAAPAGAAPGPTPVAVALGPVNCAASQDGGVWCFVLARNNQKKSVENVTAIIRMAGKDASDIVSQVAQAPLNLLPAGESLALAAYFTPPARAPSQASADLLTALPVPDDDTRYLKSRIEGQKVDLSDDGLSAKVNGQVSLTDKKAQAGQLWVAAMAYDAQGRIVGLRRWENNSTLAAGQKLKFTLWVYSTAGKIDKVDTLSEARP
jgi:LysM repeat protein